MNANSILAILKSEEKYKKNAGFFLMDCYYNSEAERVIAIGENHWYHYHSIMELDTPIWRCAKGDGPEPEIYIGKFYCRKAPLHTEREVLEYFGANTRHAIGSHFNIKELMYVRKGFLVYLKEIKNLGVYPRAGYHWDDLCIDTIKNGYNRGYNLFQLLGYNNVPDWVDYSLKGIADFRKAKALRSALIRCKADWKWQRKSAKYWVDTQFKEINEALSTIREINISFNHAYLLGGGNLQKYETSSRKKIFSWYRKLSLKTRRVLKINGENLNVATIECDIWDGKESIIKKYVVWGQDFTHHFEGSSLKEAVRYWLDRNLTNEQKLIRDGVSFREVAKFGYCLTGTKAFLNRKSKFLHSLIEKYNNWDVIPQDIMDLRFFPTEEFAHEIIQRQ